MKKIILASSSPRRKEILSSMNLDFEVFASNFDEKSVHITEPVLLCAEIARQKARAAAETLEKERPDIRDALILAADTLIFKAGTVFGKPETRAEAAHMLASYSGNSHTVVTALCALDLKEHTVYEETSESTVYFAPLRPAEIDRYLQTDEWKDAAGGYKIQGKASLFIRKIEGSYSGIMGLPLHSLYAILKKAGLAVL